MPVNYILKKTTERMLIYFFYNIESTSIDTFDMFHKINNLNVVSSEMN